jgi:hypothetical protein
MDLKELKDGEESRVEFGLTVDVDKFLIDGEFSVSAVVFVALLLDSNPSDRDAASAEFILGIAEIKLTSI